MNLVAKLMMLGGIALFVVGGVLWFGARLFPNGVPGDLFFQRGNTSIYFPIVTSIVLSIVATVVLNIIVRLFFR